MRPGARLCACAVCWAVFALSTAAQSETTPVELPERPGRLRPGEYPDYLFREPSPAPVAETSEELREKYLFGDLLATR
jgi:hypothetical protein